LPKVERKIQQYFQGAAQWYVGPQPPGLSPRGERKATHRPKTVWWTRRPGTQRWRSLPEGTTS